MSRENPSEYEKKRYAEMDKEEEKKSENEETYRKRSKEFWEKVKRNPDMFPDISTGFEA